MAQIDENTIMGYGPAEDGSGTRHAINHLLESPEWEEFVYQLETLDYVIGGAGGVANLQARQLANRSQYLKKKIDELNALVGGGNTDYASAINNALAEIRKLDATTQKNQIAHLERLMANIYLAIQMANIDPDGFDGMIVETLDGDAPDVDRTSVDVTSVVSGDDSIDVTDASNLIIGAHYQLTDGEHIEEVQIKSIMSTTGTTQRVKLYSDVINQYTDGKAKLYRSSVAIYNGRAYGGGGKKTDTWDFSEDFTGIVGSITNSASFNTEAGFELDDVHLEGGRLALGWPVAGVALKEEGGGNGTWGHVDAEGSDI